MTKHFPVLKIIFSVLSLLVPAILWAQKARFHPPKHYMQRIHIFKEQGVIAPRSILMFGDSHMEYGGDWNRFFGVSGKIINRGIIGDDARGMLHRLGSVLEAEPKAIFFDCGTNDLSHGWSVNKVYMGVVKVLEAIKRESPSTRIYLQSLFPLCPKKGEWKTLKGREMAIVALNKKLNAYALSNNIVFIDAYSHLVRQGTHHMQERYCRDGLHLTEEGYKLLARLLHPYMAQELLEQ